MGGQHGRCDLTSTSRWHSRTQLQPSFDISLERMTGTVQKQEQGQNKSYETDRQIPADKGQFDLVFPRGKREKASILCCLVHLCGVLWLWQEGGEEAERAFTVRCVCDEATASLAADLPPCASVPE